MESVEIVFETMRIQRVTNAKLGERRVINTNRTEIEIAQLHSNAAANEMGRFDENSVASRRNDSSLSSFVYPHSFTHAVFQLILCP